MKQKVRFQYDPSVPEAQLVKAQTLLALDHFNGDKTKSARALGVTIKTVYNRLKAYGIDATARPWVRGLANDLIMPAAGQGFLFKDELERSAKMASGGGR